MIPRLYNCQLTAKCLDDLLDGIEFRRAVRSKRLVKILAAQVSFTRNLAHALGLGRFQGQ